MRAVPAVLAALFAIAPVYAQSAAPPPLLEQATSHFRAKEYDAAIAAYRRVVASDLPEEVRARAQSRIGYAYNRKGDTANAKIAWQETADKFPNQPTFAADALVRAGNLAWLAKDYPTAVASFERAVERYAATAGTPEVRATIAEGLSCLGKTYLAMAEIAKRDAPKGFTALEAWQVAGPTFEQSRIAFERLANEFSDREEWAAEAEWQLLALQYEWAFNKQGATFLDVVDAAADFLNKHPRDAVRRPKAHLVKAEALVQLRRFDDAIPELLIIREKYAATAGPALGTARYFLARCYEAKGAGDKAMAEYQTLLEGKEPSFHSASDKPAALFGMANILAGKGQKAEAITAYRRLVSEYRDTHWTGMAGRALAALEQGGTQ